MANKKFSEFDLKTSNSDVQFVVGYNGADNVRIAPSDVLGAYLPLAGGTMTGNTLHGDNVKSIYGTGSDLEIYHDGTHSRIKDVGSGNLTFNATDFIVNNSADSKQMMTIVDGGAVSLFHNASKKFETTSTGVTVTGTITSNIAASGNNVIGTLNNTDFTANNRSALKIRQQANAGGSFSAFLGANQDGSIFLSNDSITADHLTISNAGNATFAGDVDLTANSAIFLDNENNNNPVYLRNSGGNLATLQIGRGTSPGSNVTMIIDNSGNMGLGLTSPVAKLQVNGSVNSTLPSTDSNNLLLIENTNATGSCNIRLRGGDGATRIMFGKNSTPNDKLFITPRANETNHIVVDGSGNLGLGTSSPSEKLTVVSAASFRADVATGNPLISIVNNTATSSTVGTATIKFTQANTQAGGKIISGRDGDYSVGATRASNLQFYTSTAASDTEKMRLDSSGNLGIGTSSIIEKLTVFGQVCSTSSSSTSSTSGANRAIIDLSGGGARMGHFRGGDSAGSGFLKFYTDSTERMRLDSAGALLVGTTTAISTAVLQVEGSSANTSSYIIQKNTNSGASAFVSFKQYSDSGQCEYWRNSSARTGSGGANSQNIYNSNGVINLWAGGVQNLTLQNDGDLELLQNNKGLILKSANGTAYRITVADNGTVTSTAV